MSELRVTSNLEVITIMIKKPKTDPEGCTGDIKSMTDALEILGGKWRLLIVHYLFLREKDINTFKKIEKDIVGISAKMLSKELKILEVNKIVDRKIMDTKPVTVQYSITEYGKEVKPVISILVDWGLNHRREMFEK
ncbi:helix-turn-helix domain-containing protein [Flavobacterium branchiarum]|uniref:Winged helix-turn-helix transcriptional regulator n=1 Tax=Flavobacterium branchiarum TaxID=1114870 RepID=A0ABV5FLD7_9FLAO|nr:helix-turn-helix domain-containing protein [Flavobacterium branchiarum]MDN3674417.1 helix-turn-helix domain-containing protein [Flavobacterium branchiarum]